MRAVKGKDTTPERIARSSLHRLGFRFALHRVDIPGTPDIVMPARKSVVVVHGCFWHGHTCTHGRRKPTTNAVYWGTKIARNRERDQRAVAALRRDGWKVLVVWECQTRDAGKLAKRLSTSFA